MIWLTIIFGVLTVAGLIVSIVQLLTQKKRSAVERTKVISQLERIEHAKFSAALIRDTVHLAIQRAKETDRSDIADVLRIARGSLEVLIRELEAEKLKLKSWRFGEIFSSDAEVEAHSNYIKKKPSTKEESENAKG